MGATHVPADRAANLSTSIFLTTSLGDGLVIAHVPFVVGVCCSVAVTTGLAVSILPVEYRFWPSGDDDRKLRGYLLCTRGFLLALFVTAALDWQSGPLPRLASGIVGAAVLAGGLAVAFQGGVDLGEEETRGRIGELRTDGIYRYTRNPQVVGFVAAFAGTALLANSVLAGALAVMVAVWLPLTIVAEEPWLREQYGEAYVEYCRDVPRFVGLRTVRRVVAVLQ